MGRAIRSAMAQTAYDRWMAAGFDVQSCQFWKFGRRTVSVYMKVNSQSKMPENANTVASQLAKKQRLLAFYKVKEGNECLEYQLFSRDTLEAKAEKLNLIEQNLLHSAAFLKQDKHAIEVADALANIREHLGTAMDCAKHDQPRNAGVAFEAARQQFDSAETALSSAIQGIESKYMYELSELFRFWSFSQA